MPKLTPLQARFSDACQSLNIPCTPEHLAALAQAAKPPKEPTALQKMTSAMLEVSRWPESKFSRAVRAAQAMLKEGKTEADVRLHYGFSDPGAGVWWWRRSGTDFRNRNNADPTPDIILETCQKWESVKAKPACAPMPQPTQSTLLQAQWLVANGMGD